MEAISSQKITVKCDEEYIVLEADKIWVNDEGVLILSKDSNIIARFREWKYHRTTA